MVRTEYITHSFALSLSPRFRKIYIFFTRHELMEQAKIIVYNFLIHVVILIKKTYGVCVTRFSLKTYLILLNNPHNPPPPLKLVRRKPKTSGVKGYFRWTNMNQYVCNNALICVYYSRLYLLNTGTDR